MSIFEPMRDFFHKRAAKDLKALVSNVHLVTASAPL